MPLATDTNLVSGEDMIFEWMGTLRWVKSKESPLSVKKGCTSRGPRNNLSCVTIH